MSNTKRIVIIALFVALAVALNMVERAIIIPGAPPGVKLGLANVMTLLSILMLGYKDAFLVVVVRCLLGALLGGTPVSFLFSITGGVLSALAMIVLWHYFKKHISIVNISIIGAVCHNIGQLFIAALLARDFLVYVMLPVLMVSSVVTGYIVGVLTRRIHKSLIARNIKVYETDG